MSASLEDGLLELSGSQDELQEAQAREAQQQAALTATEQRAGSLREDLEATRGQAAKASADGVAARQGNEAFKEAKEMQQLQLQEDTAIGPIESYRLRT